MITFTNGNIFDSPAQALVNPVNCVGVMGAGLALQFKKRYPDNFQAYAAACRSGQVHTGRIFLFDRGEGKVNRYIANFPTKRHWRNPSRPEYIEEGLAALAQTIQQQEITSIALPPLGAGLGGLPWPTVRRSIQQRLALLHGVRITVLEPPRPQERRTGDAASPTSPRPSTQGRRYGTSETTATPHTTNTTPRPTTS